MTNRVQGLIVGVLVGAFFAGGVAYAVTVVPPNDTDRYYACVSTTGIVRYGTMRLNVQPTSCPKAGDTVRSWNAKGPQGPQGPAGPAGPPGSPGLVVLTVHVIGLGTVTAPGISCGLDCSAPFVLGETPGMQATAAAGTGDAGSVFVGWSGDCTGSGSCSLNMNGPRSVTATFEPMNITGTVAVTPLPDPGQWTIVFTNDGSAARNGLTAHINSLPESGSQGPLYIHTMTTSRGTLTVTPYQPGWDVTNDFDVSGIDLAPGYSVTIHVTEYPPCNTCSALLQATITSPGGGSVQTPVGRQRL